MAKKAKEEKAKKKAKKAKEVETKVKEKKAQGKKVKAEAEDEDESDAEVSSGFNPYAEFNHTMDEIAKKMSDADTLDDIQPQSTGSLAIDILLGGGIRPAWYTNAGPEQSAKTTEALQVMASMIKQNVPIIALRDFEGSTGNSLPYVTSILRQFGINMSKDELFGKKDPKTGKWLVPPRVRYSASTRGVGFFNWFSSLLRRLPDKKMLNGEWWLVYEDDKDTQAKYGKYGDKTMAKKYGKGIYIKAPDGGLQGVVILDSYPNMNPDAKDEDEGDNSLALQARMFSKNLPRVKGYLASKKVAVIGINQLRDVPMAMYGPSETEPCGKALRYNSDVRLRFYPRSLSSVPLWPVKAKKGGLEVEQALGGGKDFYKYIHISTIKNKLSTDNRECWMRIWAKDANKQGRGIDPVFDTIYYLWMTGQLTSAGRGQQRKAFNLNLGEKYKIKKTLSWDDLKLWVLGEKAEIVALCKKLGLEKPIKLRDFCFKQIAKGEGERMYAAHESAADRGDDKAKGGNSEPDDDDDDGDD